LPVVSVRPGSTTCFCPGLRGWRNQVWETDHVQAPVLVDVEGTVRRSWITWFVSSSITKASSRVLSIITSSPGAITVVGTNGGALAG